MSGVTSNTVTVTVAPSLTGTFYIHGFCYDSVTGVALVGVSVWTTVNGVDIYRKTNALGAFTFGFLPNGTYTLRARLTGYITGAVTETVNGANVGPVTIDLVAG